MRKWAGAILGLALAGQAIGVHAEEADTVPEQEAPAIPVWEIGFSPEGLSGPGAAILEAEMENAQFVALGEDHGYAAAPMLARGLAAEMRKDGQVHHAAEIGPHSEQVVKRALTEGGVEELARVLKGKPLAIPFLGHREDAELAQEFVREDGAVDLWGVDQEFLGSPLLLLGRLAELAPSDDARQMIAEMLDSDREAMATGDQEGLLMLSAPPEKFEALRAKFPDSGEAWAIIDSMAESAVIYQYNSARRYFDNNYERIELIKQQFLAEYHRRYDEAPRVLLKMGAFHLGRGTTPTRMFDLGSLLPGLAAANQKTSLHIVYGALDGEQLAMGPASEGYFQVRPVKDQLVTPLLEAAGMDLSAIGPTGHYLIPLDPIRRKLGGKGIGELGQLGQFLVLGFDYIVTTRAGRAATPLVK
ncbi:hypothetical protein SAMN02745824_1286 [Parasphingorhabdus marina DSM 22363]|uniref:Erythromycin esterase n=1 Tax=Parasphingorhabdus marina DSM 22363 TaxID=1123272 RepID=A0A1N6CZ58_9SPHN|nr:hypothetical protein [Parasphingorhabdus marina]SIN63746.1 hypothetical protein SAMN02745824_1286 [Parasphingorhabdus marina DSM 22363]